MGFYLIHNYCKINVKPTFIFDEIATIRVGGGGDWIQVSESLHLNIYLQWNDIERICYVNIFTENLFYVFIETKI